ncbi:MAG: hypothetical protein ABEJ69_00520 [Candidatus Nanohaloarchaea archaeon]
MDWKKLSGLLGLGALTGVITLGLFMFTGGINVFFVLPSLLPAISLYLADRYDWLFQGYLVSAAFQAGFLASLTQYKGFYVGVFSRLFSESAAANMAFPPVIEASGLTLLVFFLLHSYDTGFAAIFG